MHMVLEFFSGLNFCPYYIWKILCSEKLPRCCTIWTLTFTCFLCDIISAKVGKNWICSSGCNFPLYLWFFFQIGQNFRYFINIDIIRLIRLRHGSGCIILSSLSWYPPLNTKNVWMAMYHKNCQSNRLKIQGLFLLGVSWWNLAFVWNKNVQIGA